MNDLRRWRDDPAAMVEWLLGGAWKALDDHTRVLRTNDGPVCVVSMVPHDLGGEGVGWAVDMTGSVLDAMPEDCLLGSDTGLNGLNAASLAILASSPVWRMPSGGDILLGRWPTDEEMESARVWTGCLAGGVVVPRLSVGVIQYRRDAVVEAPIYCIPLRPDGLPGSLKP